MSNMDTRYNIWYLPSESKHVNKWKSQQFINYHVNYCVFTPTAGALFTTNTILYLKTAALIIFNKTENHKQDIFLKIYALILVILICYLNLQYLK